MPKSTLVLALCRIELSRFVRLNALLSERGEMKSFYLKEITTPHIPLNISSDDALRILKSVSLDIEIEREDEATVYRTTGNGFQFGFYEKNGIVSSTWYNDPSGRRTKFGKRKKVGLYLERYGDKEKWEKGINNGWIQFFFNESEKVGMAYGIHMDVIRFNSFSDAAA